ncbi:unnamed protein product [Leuciscus chuanchicus]
MRERFRQSQLIDRHIELPFLPLSLYSTPPERHSDSENPPFSSSVSMTFAELFQTFKR